MCLKFAQTRLIFIFMDKLILNDKILKSDQNYYKLDQMFLHVSLFLSKGNKCIHVQNNEKIKIKMVWKSPTEGIITWYLIYLYYGCSRLSIQHHQLAKEYEEAARGLLRRSTKQRRVSRDLLTDLNFQKLFTFLNLFFHRFSILWFLFFLRFKKMIWSFF